MANTDDTPVLTDYDKVIQGLEIFKKYPGHPHYVTAEHDMLFAGPRPSKVSEEDIAKLASLGWNPEDNDDCFIKFS